MEHRASADTHPYPLVIHPFKYVSQAASVVVVLGAVAQVLETHFDVVESKTHDPESGTTFSQSVAYAEHAYKVVTQVVVPSNLHKPF